MCQRLGPQEVLSRGGGVSSRGSRRDSQVIEGRTLGSQPSLSSSRVLLGHTSHHNAWLQHRSQNNGVNQL